jgi:superfamily II DNA or RNA helicase
VNAPAYTGKCGACGHAETAHRRTTPRTCHNRACRGLCAAYEPVVDIEAHNSTNGRPAVELYEFQRQYLKGLPSKYIFAADTGTGKTFMALAHYDAHRYPEPLLILAPASKVQTGDWERELKEYFAGRILPEYEVYSYEKFTRVPTVAQFKKTGDRGLWRDYMDRHPGGFAIIADEVHKAKNPQSGIGKRVYELTRAVSCRFFVGLSATPLPNGWIDAANYFKIFGFSKGITEFKKRYCEIVDFKGFPEIRGYWREGELQDYWNRIAKPLSKQLALDLPPITTVPVSLPAGPGYVRVQKERLFNDKFLDNPSALAHALRQSIIDPKVKWLDNFLEGASDNVVVFYNYTAERDAILAMVKKNHKGRQVFRQDGEKHGVPGKDRWAGLNRTITLAQYQSGSTGIELTYAATIVYFSPTYSYSNYEQSVGRINRNGQTQKMTLYMLCAPATIERAVWGALREKRDFQDRQWYEEAQLQNT